MMEINSIHEFISNHSLLDLFKTIDAENLFYFKSKYSDLEFIAYGEFTLVDLGNETSKTPHFIIGDFEGTPKIFKSNNYISKQDNQYNVCIINPVKTLDETNYTPSLFTRFDQTSKEEWNDQISNIFQEIKMNNFKKIVLSRDVLFKTESINWKSFTKQLLNENQDASDSYFIYYKTEDQLFISLTPERLFELKDNHLESIALAGSMPVTSDEELNLKNRSFLLNNSKLIHEHQIVTDEMTDRFKTIVTSTKVSSLEIMKLNYIQHRMNKISGTLKSNTTIHDILNLLHPTPAVGTMPKHNGIQIINRIEKRLRKNYAAPIGIITEKVTELAVGLRSANINLKTNSIILHSGCGIVDGSNADMEWAETENKMKPFLKVINL